MTQILNCALVFKHYSSPITHTVLKNPAMDDVDDGLFAFTQVTGVYVIAKPINFEGPALYSSGIEKLNN